MLFDSDPVDFVRPKSDCQDRIPQTTVQERGDDPGYPSSEADRNRTGAPTAARCTRCLTTDGEATLEPRV